MKISRSTFLLALLTLTATLVGMALRIHFAAEPLWIDELHTAWAIDADFSDTAFRAGQGNQTPIHFWISWLVCKLLGYSEFGLRLPSIVFSSLTIVLAALFVWRYTHDAVVSGVVAMLVAIDSWFIFYGSEARPYALLQLLSVLQIGCLADAMANDDSSSRMGIEKPVSWPLMLLTSAMIATHLTAMILVAVQLLFVLAFGNPLYRRRIVSSLIVSLIVILPLLPIMAAAYEKRADWTPISDRVKLLQDAAPGLLVYLLFPAICLLGLRMYESHLFTKRGDRNRCRSKLEEGQTVATPDVSRNNCLTTGSSDAKTGLICNSIVGLILVWGLGPLMIVWLLEFSGTIPLAAYRYTVAGSVAFPIFAGLAIAAIRSEKLRLPVCLITILLAAGINPIADFGLYSKSRRAFRNEDWKSAIEHLMQTPEFPNQPVFLFANLLEDHRSMDLPRESTWSDYLKFPLAGIYQLPGQHEIIPMPTQALSRWNANHLSLIQQFKGARIIARVTSPDMQSIVDELQAIARANSVEIDCEIYLQPGNAVKTAFISCKN